VGCRVTPAPTPTALLKALVADAVNSRESKRAYSRALDHFFKWLEAKGARFTKATVQAYRAELVEAGLAPSTVNLRMTAIRRLAAEAADNRMLEPEIASAIARVKGARRQGVRIGNWLTVPLAEALLNEPDTQTLKGKRESCRRRAHDRPSCVQHREGVCGSDRRGSLCTTRPAPIVCETRPQRPRPPRADSAVARPCVYSDDRAVFGRRAGLYGRAL
jgi:hypothetical protein